jgi:hypothetical protein
MKVFRLFRLEWILLVFSVWTQYILSIPVATSRKCITHFEAAWHKFPGTGNGGPRANRHRNMSCFGGSPAFVSASQKPRATKREPETYHPSKHVKFRWCGPTCVLMLGQPEPLKHVTFWELCFGPNCPSSMFPMRSPSMTL